MLLTKNKINKPEFIHIKNNKIEVVSSFKLLGVEFNDHLDLQPYVDSQLKTIRAKTYSIKRLFFLSENTRLHFFKSFVLPHFDYCNSLVIYLCKTQINQLEHQYNASLFHLLNLRLNSLDIFDQYSLLKKFNLFPYKYRVFYRLSLFMYKIMNGNVLQHIKDRLISSDLTEESTTNLTRYRKRCILASQNTTSFETDACLFVVPKRNTKSGELSISIFLPNFINKILKKSYDFNFSEFKFFILHNILILYSKFELSFSYF
jgi:hypothetical protein